MLLLNILLVLIKPILLLYSVLLMVGRWNMWSPWYLMPKDKPRKVECKFCGNVILDGQKQDQLDTKNNYHSCSHIFAHKCKKVESKCFQSLSNHHATQ